MSDDLPEARHRDLFGGRGEVRVRDAFGPTQRGAFTAALRCELAPGGHVGAHRQQRDDELVICVGGRGWAQVDEAQHALSADAPALFVPHGSTLSLGAAAETTLCYVIVKARVP